jgi:hypothetical protein
MVHRPHPRWWRGAHCAFYEADILERVAVCRARSQSALARHKATRSSQHRGCTSLGFEDVVSPLSNEDEDDRDTAVGDDDDPPPPPQSRSTTTLPSPPSFVARRRWCGGFRIQDLTKLLQQKK